MFVTRPNVRVPSTCSASTMSKGFTISSGPSQNENFSEEFGSRSVADALPMILRSLLNAGSFNSSAIVLEPPFLPNGSRLGRPLHAGLERLGRDKPILYRLLGQVDRVEVCMPARIFAVRRHLAL